MPDGVSRRRALGAAGVVGIGALLGACSREGAVTETQVPTTSGASATVQPQSTPSPANAALFGNAATCTLSPEQTEGPYYFDVDSIRGDIREDRPGMPLRLVMRVQDSAACTPIANAVVDIWHCDAGGVYSGFESASQGSGGGPGRGGPPGGGGGGGSARTDDETYLRGAQVTNSDGIVEFTTIYPGWYRGRTVHIHTKVHLDTSTLLTSQLYFDEQVTAAVHQTTPYASRSGRDTFNDGDGIFSGAGERALLTLAKEGDGYRGVITLAVKR
jgi:protocatechuate 3,4-dioxygenase beta subunit